MNRAVLIKSFALCVAGLSLCTRIDAQRQKEDRPERVSRQQRDSADGEIRRGKVKRLDLEKKTITITSEGKDIELQLRDDTRVIGSTGADLRERLRGFDEGADVQFQAMA